MVTVGARNVVSHCQRRYPAHGVQPNLACPEEPTQSVTVQSTHAACL